MKSFKFKYAIAVYVMLVAVIILSIVGAVWNVYSAIEYFGVVQPKAVSSMLTAILCLVLLIIAFLVLFNGKYIIKDGNLTTRIGVFAVKTPVREICAVTHFKKSDKLVVYFDEAKFSVIVISPEFYEQFISSLKETNPAILYSSQNDEKNV
ncbi:MAG: PH domain-containing protein [Clostridia bacterium]|nr:PH domain-containing protein [Clostridia bacterium]